MKVGIVGKPGSGKTTLFHALCRGQAQMSHTKEPVHGVVVVPDPRFDYFVELYQPKKTHPASIDFVDDIVRMSNERGRELTDEAMGELRTADAFVYIIDAFDAGDPVPSFIRQEAVSFVEELGLRDLMLIENRMERIVKQAKAAGAPASLKVEHGALAKVKDVLEAGGRFRDAGLEENEVRALAGFQLLTSKPLVVAANVPESYLPSAEEALADVEADLAAQDIPAFCLSAEIEKEVSELPDEDQQEFLKDLGINEPARDRLIRAIYSSCNLITFFTVSEKEVHAWPLRAGSTALEAADSIHSDLARGFIRAEIVSWEDIHEAGGWDNAKAAGKLKLVGKEHIVNDGDSLYIRFKV